MQPITTYAQIVQSELEACDIVLSHVSKNEKLDLLVHRIQVVVDALRTFRDSDFPIEMQECLADSLKDLCFEYKTSASISKSIGL